MIYIKIRKIAITFDVIFVLLIILSRRNCNFTSSFRKFAHSHRYSTREFLRLRDSGTVVAFTFDFCLPVSLRLSQFSRLYATEGTIWNAGDARTRVLSGAKNEVLFGNRKREKERERERVWRILNNNGCVRRLDSKEGKLKGEKWGRKEYEEVKNIIIIYNFYINN